MYAVHRRPLALARAYAPSLVRNAASSSSSSSSSSLGAPAVQVATPVAVNVGSTSSTSVRSATTTRGMRSAGALDGGLRLGPAGDVNVPVLSATAATPSPSLPIVSRRKVEASPPPPPPIEEPGSKQDAVTSERDEVLESLSPMMRKGLVELGATNLFPVQVNTLLASRQNKDVLIRSVTGSGKTLAFCMPLVEHILKEQAAAPTTSRARGVRPKALVLVPTRELAIQCHKVLTTLAPSVRCGLAYGGVQTGDWVRRPVDVVIGTLGRVKDLIDRGTVDFSEVRVAVLDEADTMLMVESNEVAVSEIFQTLPPKDQRINILCSASIPEAVHAVAREYMNKYEFIDLAGQDKKLPDTIAVVATPVADGGKIDALAQVLGNFFLARGRGQPVRALVFTMTRQESENLMEDERMYASKLFKCRAIHGGFPQRQREQVMDSFSRGSVNVLISTDLTARGLDISNVDLVVHYDTPGSEDAFMHRTGRTGRAGKIGTSVLFYAPNFNLESLERACGVRFIRRGVPTLSPSVLSIDELSSAESKPWLNVADAVINNEKFKGDAKQAMAAILAMLEQSAPASTEGSANQQQEVYFSALNGRMDYQTLVCAANNRDKVHRLPGGESTGSGVMSADGSMALFDVKVDDAKQLCLAAAEQGKFLLAPLVGDVPKLASAGRGPSGYRMNYASRGYGGGRGGGSGRGGGGGRGGGYGGGGRGGYGESRYSSREGGGGGGGRSRDYEDGGGRGRSGGRDGGSSWGRR